MLSGNYFQMDSFAVLQEMNNLEQVFRARITFWAKHSHQAFGGNVRCVCQFAEPDSRVYVVPQNGLACIYVTSQ